MNTVIPGRVMLLARDIADGVDSRWCGWFAKAGCVVQWKVNTGRQSADGQPLWEPVGTASVERLNWILGHNEHTRQQLVDDLIRQLQAAANHWYPDRPQGF